MLQRDQEIDPLPKSLAGKASLAFVLSFLIDISRDCRFTKRAAKGKSARIWRLGVHDRRIARIVKACQELPGQHLFQYLDEAGERQAVTSSDVKVYLKKISGADITAKDFRTWTDTALAAIQCAA